MAVKVQTPAGTQDVTHDQGGAVLVKDGHLYVLDGTYTNAKTLAIYAPGQWRNSVVE